MKHNDIEKKLSRAFEHITPQENGKFLSPRSEKGTVIEMSHIQENQPRKKSWTYKVAGIAAACVIFFSGAFGYMQYEAAYAVDSVVDLDVNPSIELTLNKKEEVLSATALNADAEAILDGMDLSKTDLDVALNAIIGSMVKQGYISELANSILISVENDNAQRGTELQARLAAEIEELLRANSIDPAVLSQTVSSSSAQTLADEYGISLGKASLIEEIVNANNLLNPAELAKLSVNELLLLADSKAQAVVGNVSGSASDKAYIGEAAAKAAAYAHAGIAETDISYQEIGMDVEHGAMVYEVEFYVGNLEYDYEIDAKTGEVVKYSQETEKPYTPPTTSGTGSSAYISAEEAKAAAFAHAGVSAANAANCRVEMDEDDGLILYEVDFYAGNTEYDYEINAITSAVIKYSSEVKNNTVSTGGSAGSAQQPSSGNSISAEEAKAAAFAHAGVSAANAQKVEVERDMENGMVVYEIEFKSGGMEYSYEINASNGAILSYESEWDD